MRKYLLVILGILLAFSMTACGSSARDTVNEDDQNRERSAVVYFSATGNTREVAELLAQEADADIFEIIPEDKYTSDDLNYNDDNCRATVYTFCTSGGSGIEQSISDLQGLYPHVNIADGKRLNAADETEINEWIKKN